MHRSLRLFAPLLPLLAAACGAPHDPAASGSDQAVVEAEPLFADKIGNNRTRFPILLEHGFAASAEPASIWRFVGVADDLMDQGHALVLAGSVEPFDDVGTRAASMENHVRAAADKCRTVPGCDPSGVHVVAHSFGGLHAREYVRLHPPSKAREQGLPRVVSVTTVATPNRGTNVADFALKLIEALKGAPAVETAFENEVNKLAALVGHTFTKDELVHDPHVARALHDLSEANADRFAAAHPADPDVKYFAWAAVSINPNPVLYPLHPERVAAPMPAACGPSLAFQNRAFASDALLIASHDITGHLLENLPNDGMATVESAKGLPGATFMGCLPADHLAEVGHVSTSAKTAWSGFDHKIFYRYVASTLADVEAR